MSKLAKNIFTSFINGMINITNQSKTYKQPVFKATFVKSDALTDIVNYAVKHNKFEKLNQARVNIGSTFFNIKLKVDIGMNEDLPFVRFLRYKTKDWIINPQNEEDYFEPKEIIVQSSKKKNPLEFAYETIVRLGNGVPCNKLYQRVVIKK